MPLTKSGVELRASYHGPLRVRLLLSLFVILVGIAVIVVTGVALRIYL